MLKNKKGQSTVFLFALIFVVFFMLILIFVGGVIVVKVNQALDQNVNIGQVNLATLNSQTFGVATTTYLNNADWWGLSIIFGMVFGLLLSAYILRGRFPKWGIVLDIFIILTAFFISLYISSSYSILLDALNVAREDFMEVYTPKTAMFVLNLPIFTVIIGVLTMILFHASIPKRKEEQSQLQGGFLQAT